MGLEKRLREYERMGEVFWDMEGDVMGVRLWKGVVRWMEGIVGILGEIVGMRGE